VLTNRILRFLHDKSTKDAAEYNRFYKDYGMFLKEGIVTTNEQLEKASHVIYLCCIEFLGFLYA
jgi:TNF receptor-associated protein 1